MAKRKPATKPRKRDSGTTEATNRLRKINERRRRGLTGTTRTEKELQLFDQASGASKAVRAAAIVQRAKARAAKKKRKK